MSHGPTSTFLRTSAPDIYTEDARRYVQRTDETYDLIIIDAYYSDSLPYHLTTQEFLGEVDARLTPGGVVAYNVISAVEGDGSELFRSMYRTAGLVWDNVWVFPIGDRRGRGRRGTPQHHRLGLRLGPLR